MQSHMVNFNTYFMPVIMSMLAQRVGLFNAASKGTIVLTAEGFTGDFIQQSFYKSLASAQRRVDRYGANNAVTPTNLEQLKKSGVKVAGGIGPVLYEPSQMTWLEKPKAEGIAVASAAFVEIMLQDMLNASISCLVAAIGNQAAATNDVSATDGMSYSAVNKAHSKFGDASGQLVASVCTGTVMHGFIEKNLANGAALFKAENVQVIDILGRPFIVTDAPALYQAGTPNKSKVLSLTTGAVTVYDGKDVITNIETKNGNERIETTLQTDYSFGVALKGYTWDETNGGKSPSDAELATGTNWDLVAESIKHSAGVITIADADK